MKKCTCSATNPDDANFCRICGRKFDDSVPGITEKTNRSFPEPANKPTNEPTKIVRGVKFVLIKGGTFTMGSPTKWWNVKNWNLTVPPDEYPSHKVTVSDFYMSETTITNAQFRDCLNSEGSSYLYVLSNEYGSCLSCRQDFGMRRAEWSVKSQMENHPVVNISLDEARHCCEYLGGRLPSEAEWEYACRAGTDTPFNTGMNLAASQANFNGCPSSERRGSRTGIFLGRTQPVGSYPPNAWGLYDMHGNVREWCRDKYGKYPSSPQINPVVSGVGDRHVLRGGSWKDEDWNCRSACRRSEYGSLTFRDTCVGFRAVIPVQ
jgi:formylglycine-generating enzyme required for sulfatase activity